MKVKILCFLIVFFIVGFNQICLSGVFSSKEEQNNDDRKDDKKGTRPSKPPEKDNNNRPKRQNVQPLSLGELITDNRDNNNKQRTIIISVNSNTSNRQLQEVIQRAIENSSIGSMPPPSTPLYGEKKQGDETQENVLPTPTIAVNNSPTIQEDSHQEASYTAKTSYEEEKRKEEVERNRLELEHMRLENEERALENEKRRQRLEEEKKKREEEEKAKKQAEDAIKKQEEDKKHKKEESAKEETSAQPPAPTAPITSASEQEKEKKALGFTLPKGFPVEENENYKSLTIPQLCKIWVYPSLSYATHLDMIDVQASNALKEITERDKALKWLNHIINHWAKSYHIKEQASLILNVLSENMKSMPPEYIKFAVKQQDNKCKLLITIPGGEVIFMKIPG